MGGVVSSKKKEEEGRSALSGIGVDVLNASDFHIGKYLAEGGSGKIHIGRRKSDQQLVALKFFGYVDGWEDDGLEITDEMSTMASMNHIDSVIRIYGYFMDTEPGLIPRKLCSKPYPVIVMEYMGGGPLFGRLNYQENVSEKYLANVFKSILISVDHLHKEGFVHRDLKLENIMYVDKSENSQVRIIDLGMCAKVDSSGIFIETMYLVGTPGCYAPESLTRNEYSVKSDVWQLGCILYMLLSGLNPFHRERTEQITHRGYYKMEGKGWTDISDTAKDLVHLILRKKSENRLSIAEILAHKWMVEATETTMDDEYKTRIKRLALRDKMQKFFRENKGLSAGNAERVRNLQDNVPLLKQTSVVPEQPKPPPELQKQLSEFNGKLKHLKTLVVRKMSSDFSEKDHEIDYESFVLMLNHCHLDELCTPAVFNIFDIGNTGTIDPKEFLMTMIAFRPSMQSAGAKDTDEESEALLYFDMFDINETGYIDLDELKLAVKFLLFMGSDQPQDLPNVEELFDAMDVAKNGRIDFDEFKAFHKQLLASHSLVVSIEPKKSRPVKLESET